MKKRIGELTVNRRYSRIGKRAVKAAVIPTSLVLIVAVVCTIVFSYQFSLTQLQRKVERLGSEHLVHLAELLWQFDVHGIEEQLQYFVDQEDIQHVVVLETSGKTMERGSPSGVQDPVISEFQLLHGNGKGVIEVLGTLSIEGSKSTIWSTAFRRVIILVTVVILSASLVVVLIMRQVRKSVLTPILKIAQTLHDSPSDLRELHIDLQRDSSDLKNDELDDLVDSIHDMRDQILTARKTAEERDRKFVQAAHMAGLAHCTMDVTMTRILSCDENYAAMHRRSVAEMLVLHVQKDLLEGLLDEASINHLNAGRLRVLDGSKEIQDCRLDFADGEFIYLRQYYVGRTDENGVLEAINVIAQDVTEEMHTQDMLLQSQKIEAIGKLTGGVAHDFNNILAVITGNLELCIGNTDRTRVDKSIETALQAVTRGANLTQQLLSFARRQPLTPVVLDAAKLVRDSTQLLRTSAGDSIVVEIVCDPNSWNTRADPVQLGAVLLNLVVNARDSMPSGGVLIIEISNVQLDHVYARSNLEVKSGSYVCIAVTDTGEGMSTEVLERSIEPFFTTKAIGEGTGLGLSMAYGFAKQSGGHLKIYSEDGQGTTVKLYLPRVKMEEANTSPVFPVNRESSLSGLSVLLIEDNEVLRETIAEQIALLGCMVHAAFDRQSVMKLLVCKPRVDIILTDIVLAGGTDGLQLAQQVLVDYPDVKIVYMSGYTEKAVSHAGLAEEGCVFLQKPFRLADLSRALVKLTSDKQRLEKSAAT